MTWSEPWLMCEVTLNIWGLPMHKESYLKNNLAGFKSSALQHWHYSARDLQSGG